MQYTSCGILQMELHSRIVFMRDFAVLGSDLSEKRRAQIANDSIRFIDQMKKEECWTYSNNIPFFEELRKEIESTLFSKMTSEEAEILMTEIEKRQSKSEWISFSTYGRKKAETKLGEDSQD